MTTFRSGYGDFTYGNLLYGIDAADVTGAASVSLTSTATSFANTVKDASASVSISSSTYSNGGYDAKGSTTANLTSSTALYWNRIRPFAASDTSTSDTTRVTARYKWLDASDPTTTWTTADYLERAA